MRIAFFTETFLPKVDGVANTLCRVLEHLAARGHAALVFAPQGAPAEYAGAGVVGVPAREFFLYRELKLAAPWTPVSAALTPFRPDLIHVLNPVSLGLAGMWYARSRRIPLVASYHTDVPGFAARWGWGWLAPALWALFRVIHNFANLNLAPSRVTLRELRDRHFRRVKVWSRGVDTRLFHPNRRTAEWRERLTGGSPASPLLLFVGRLSVEKRAHWLLPVLEALPQARLAVVGDGPARPELERIFAGRPAVFTGYLRGEALAQAYAAADIFVFPAANETLGNVVLEAMASGLPVVAPRSGGLLDHVAHARNGLLVEPDDVRDLIAAVGQLLARPDDARRLGAAGRQHAEAHRWEGVLDRLLDDYGALLQRHARMLRVQRVKGMARAAPLAQG